MVSTEPTRPALACLSDCLTVSAGRVTDLTSFNVLVELGHESVMQCLMAPLIRYGVETVVCHGLFVSSGFGCLEGLAPRLKKKTSEELQSRRFRING